MLKPRKHKIFIAIVALSFFLLGSFGVLHFGMMQPDGQMSGCPFMDEGAICQMNPLEHLAAWQSAFTTTIPGKSLASLLLLSLLPFLALQIGRHNFAKDKDSPVQIFRVRYRERLFFPSPLQEAFSNGILNSKVF
ncbi:hypothetical protein HY418_03175 [Candidatus Kaiserbacteria bacterium]|nr:hypothetical protein [Candidatus Kaiserbacteria bacterium]